MNYWLFVVMYDWYPKSWTAMIDGGVAAQNYPPGWKNETKNINALSKLRPGDRIVAAFMGYRFGGYATLLSAISRGQRTLPIRDGRRILQFGESFGCDWTVIPRECGKAFVDCRDLHKKGFLVKLQRGLCVSATDARTFHEIKSRLDKAGASSPGTFRRALINSRADVESIRAEEGRQIRRYSNYYERDSGLRAAAISIHGRDCMVCGFNFETTYGERGEDFIEVHHLRPIASFGKRRLVSPMKHMAVVCSNCHRMIHRRKDHVLSLEQLKALIRR